MTLSNIKCVFNSALYRTCEDKVLQKVAVLLLLDEKNRYEHAFIIKYHIQDSEEAIKTELGKAAGAGTAVQRANPQPATTPHVSAGGSPGCSTSHAAPC